MFRCLALVNLSITDSVSIATSLPGHGGTDISFYPFHTTVLIERSHDAEVAGIVSNTQRIRRHDHKDLDNTVHKPTEPNPEIAIGFRRTPFHEHQYAAQKCV